MNDENKFVHIFDVLCLHFPIPLSRNFSTFDFQHSNWWLYLQKSKCSVMCIDPYSTYRSFGTSNSMRHIVLGVTHMIQNDSNACSWMEILEIMSRLATNNIIYLKDFALYRSFCHSLSTHPLEWRNASLNITELDFDRNYNTFCGLSTRISEGSLIAR